MLKLLSFARLALGVDELLDVGVVAAQDPHLRAAARAGGFDRRAGLVEDVHVADRPARRAVGAAHCAPRGRIAEKS